LVTRAAELARLAHADQFRRDGVTPYIEHPAAVARRVAGDPMAEATAWLHDVLEDTTVTESNLRSLRIPEEVIAAVRLLTKSSDVAYEDYLQSIKANPLARKVKVADMLCNLADQPTDAQIVKYAKGLLVLFS
jgi:(p)ppGpp synthase/HD superfamily hydrolase